MRFPLASLAVSLMIAACAAGCSSSDQVIGSGVSRDETRAVEAFHAVRLDGAPSVEVTIGQQPSVIITTDDNILPMIDTAVRDRTLVIGSHDAYSTHLGVKITIVTPSLDAFEVNGSGNVNIKGLSGGTFRATIRGSGDLTADGSVDSISASIAGSGNLKLAGLKARSVDVSIAGSGNATVNAEESVDASIAGSGDVRYAGNPSKVHGRVAGSGRLRRL
jgi:Putative auto-transporter adhesin, head GIN domain